MQFHAHPVPHPIPHDVGLMAPILYALGPILLGIGAIYHGRANLERARRGR